MLLDQVRSDNATILILRFDSMAASSAGQPTLVSQSNISPQHALIRPLSSFNKEISYDNYPYTAGV
jgi:hypothetical protein